MPTLSTAQSKQVYSGNLTWAGYLLGFGFGGFFDGILLHQILQWHHLLTNVKSPFFQDIKNQILADGLFHVLMYFIAFFGLWKLWKGRKEFGKNGADKHLLGSAFIGFGAWHILDSILSHWILGIHRIRVDSENVLFWDLLWFFVFGVAFLVIGIKMRRNIGGESGPGYRSTATALTLAFAVIVAGPIAALPPKNVSTVMVFFNANTPPTEIFKAIDAVDGRIIWSAGAGDVWAVDVQNKGKTDVFYKHGAYLVSNSALAVGCLAWSSAET